MGDLSYVLNVGLTSPSLPPSPFDPPSLTLPPYISFSFPTLSSLSSSPHLFLHQYTLQISQDEDKLFGSFLPNKGGGVSVVLCSCRLGEYAHHLVIWFNKTMHPITYM